jgi:hypothetical protein
MFSIVGSCDIESPEKIVFYECLLNVIYLCERLLVKFYFLWMQGANEGEYSLGNDSIESNNLGCEFVSCGFVTNYLQGLHLRRWKNNEDHLESLIVQN